MKNLYFIDCEQEYAHNSLDIAYMKIKSSYQDCLNNIVNTICVYVWPALFKDETMKRALDIMESTIKGFFYDYPILDQKHTKGFFGKLVWTYIDEQIDKDERFDKLYDIFSSKDWTPNFDDIAIIDYCQDKRQFLNYLYNFQGVEKTINKFPILICQNSFGFINFTNCIINVNYKKQNITSIDYLCRDNINDNGNVIAINDLIDDKWVVFSITEFKDSMFCLHLETILHHQ